MTSSTRPFQLLLRGSFMTTLLIVALSVFMFLPFETYASSGRISVEGTHFKMDGGDIYLNGTNTPWHTWNEFWSPRYYAQYNSGWWDQEFTRLNASGIMSGSTLVVNTFWDIEVEAYQWGNYAYWPAKKSQSLHITRTTPPSGGSGGGGGGGGGWISIPIIPPSIVLQPVLKDVIYEQIRIGEYLLNKSLFPQVEKITVSFVKRIIQSRVNKTIKKKLVWQVNAFIVAFDRWKRTGALADKKKTQSILQNIARTIRSVGR